MTHLKRLVLAAVVLSFAAAAPAYAQVTGSLNINGSSGNSTGGIGAGIDVRANASGSASSTQKKANSSAYNASPVAKVRANINSAVAVKASSTANAVASYNTLNGSTSSNSSADTFSLTRADVSASSTAFMAPTSVTSSEDYARYARSLLISDENISKISSSDSQVSVWYREPARFLGIVPVSVAVHAMVDASGTVDVSYPWWYGLFVKDDSSAQLKADLSSTAGTIARGEASATLSSAAKARLVNAVHSIMKAKNFSASASASASTSADAASY